MENQREWEAAGTAAQAPAKDEVLREPSFNLNIDFEAIVESLSGLEGKVDKNPKTAAVILAGGSGERFGRQGGGRL
jgi:2-C-methyl-D-erythritol 4-phosphate cytidylyltransferase